jgi:hypothetical protein
MATRVMLAEVVMPSTTGLTQDETINSWVFEADWPTDVGATVDIGTALEEFYVGVGSVPSDRIRYYIGASRLRGANTTDIRIYEITGHLDGSPHGSPIGDYRFNLGVGFSSGELPLEVAGALSFHGDYTGIPERAGAIRPRARLRGRVFLGPLDFVAASVAVPSRPSTTFLNAVAAKFTTLRATTPTIGTGPAMLRVWSRASAVVSPVVAGYIDDAWDTQERRGLAPSARTPA